MDKRIKEITHHAYRPRSLREKRLQLRNQNKEFNFGNNKMHVLWKQTPLLVYETILFNTYIAHCLNNLKTEKLDFYKKTYGRIYAPLSFPNSRISFDDYTFIRKIDNNFISLDSLNKDELHFTCSNIKFNFDKTKLRDLINLYVCEEDRNDCVVMGGHFTRYLPESIISSQFKWLFGHMRNRKDIDIYLLKADYSHYYVWLRTLTNVNVLSCDDSDDDYDFYKRSFYSLKVQCEANIILNFIFVIRTRLCNNTGCEHLKSEDIATFDIFHMNEMFDFQVCKIFYSYLYDSIFVPSNLLTKYDLLAKKCDRNFQTHEFLDSHFKNNK
jgi:hypothetical protein